MSEPIYKVGDKVKVVKYGSLFYCPNISPYNEIKFPIYEKDDKTIVYDKANYLVSKEGIVIKVQVTQDRPAYGLHLDNGDNYWFDEEQLTANSN